MQRPRYWYTALAVALLATAAIAGRAAEPAGGQAGAVVGAAVSEPERPKMSRYWLGLACAPVDEALRVQLDLPPGQGLVVTDVVADTPAAAAGVEKYDVLVKVNGKPIRAIDDLLAAVEEAEDRQPVALEVIRGGKSRQVKATPAKRSKPVRWPTTEPGEDATAGQWPEGLRRWMQQRQPNRLQFMWPGRILPPGVKPSAPLPGNVSLTITKQGDEPAKIVVKRGEETWEVTENELEKLPPDIRRHVEGVLGHVVSPVSPPWFLRFGVDVPDWWDDPSENPMLQEAPRERFNLQQRLDRMEKRIEQLRESFEQLRKGRSEQPKGETAEGEPAQT